MCVDVMGKSWMKMSLTLLHVGRCLLTTLSLPCFFTGFNGPVDPGYVLASQTANSFDPLTLNQAKKRPDWQQWEDTIQTELQSLQDFHTFEVCVLPPGKRPVGCKYVFELKLLLSGEIERHRV